MEPYIDTCVDGIVVTYSGAWNYASFGHLLRMVGDKVINWGFAKTVVEPLMTFATHGHLLLFAKVSVESSSKADSCMPIKRDALYHVFMKNSPLPIYRPFTYDG